MVSIDINNPPQRYDVIYADPPWAFTNAKTGGSMKSGAAAQYPTMTLDEMKALPVNELASDNALLVMWWVGSQPKEAIALLEAWGFELRNMNGFVWNKLTQLNKPFFGMGFYTRAGSESCIIATKGKFKPVCKSVRAVNHAEAQVQFEARVGRHSEKPKQVRDLIEELAGDVPRVELFARKTASGWDAFGNEV